MNCILGIDQGATKTAVAVMDGSGTIHGCGRTEGAYFPVDGMSAAMSRIGMLVRRVLAEASVPPAQIAYTVAGVTGIDYPNDERLVAGALRETLKLESAEAHNDCVIALFSGTWKPFGTGLCMGTGVNAAYLRPDGRQFVMGDYMGEELQGGSALSYRALRKVFDADLGLLPPTELTRLFLDFTGAASPFEMLRESIVHREALRRKIIPLVPRILEAAEDGDAVTLGLLDEMARELCDYFMAGLRKMDMLSVACDIVLSGGVFKGARNRLTANVTGRLSVAAPLASVVNAKYEPVVGACVMGLLRWTPFTREISERLETSARHLGLLRDAPE